MNQSFLSVGIFLAFLVCLPFAVKWFKARLQGDAAQPRGQSRLISAIAVGPQQRVVTIEAGPQNDRVWLTLGVTGQTITCLHTATAPIQAEQAPELGRSEEAQLPTN